MKEKIFFETIKIEDGKVFHIDYHNKRLNKTITDNFGLKKDIKLQNFIESPPSGLYRCKIIYDRDILQISYYPYKIREIKKLKLIKSDIDYSYKYLDRNDIDTLFEKRGEADDVLIVKEGYITDTSIANIAFFDGKKWLTPKKPLLKGTTRERLLKEQKVFLADIKVKDLKKFEKFALMNAMIGFYEIKEGIII
ncbi:aminotransferase class IV family protein [Nitrosophilus labii]|uniref:aminotransferase class IV family protein n=1 Tax=Nitrosophilus labii TaxID=2706014 RepID=UPI0016575BC0|nr:aminotransferase class IV family protein [Nitrosophilus labii]